MIDVREGTEVKSGNEMAYGAMPQNCSEDDKVVRETLKNRSKAKKLHSGMHLTMELNTERVLVNVSHTAAGVAIGVKSERKAGREDKDEAYSMLCCLCVWVMRVRRWCVQSSMK